MASAPAPEASNQIASEVTLSQPPQSTPPPKGEWSTSLRAGEDHEHEVDLKAVASSGGAQTETAIEIDTSGNIHQKDAS